MIFPCFFSTIPGTASLQQLKTEVKLVRMIRSQDSVLMSCKRPI